MWSQHLGSTWRPRLFAKSQLPATLALAAPIGQRGMGRGRPSAVETKPGNVSGYWLRRRCRPTRLNWQLVPLFVDWVIFLRPRSWSRLSLQPRPHLSSHRLPCQRRLCKTSANFRGQFVFSSLELHQYLAVPYLRCHDRGQAEALGYMFETHAKVLLVFPRMVVAPWFGAFRTGARVNSLFVILARRAPDGNARKC